MHKGPYTKYVTLFVLFSVVGTKITTPETLLEKALQTLAITHL